MPLIDVRDSFDAAVLFRRSWLDCFDDLSAWSLGSVSHRIALKSKLPVSEIALPETFKITVTTSRTPWNADWFWEVSIHVSNGPNAASLGSEASSANSNTIDYTIETDSSGAESLPDWPLGYYLFVAFTFRDMEWEECTEYPVDWPAPRSFDAVFASEILSPSKFWTSFIGTTEVTP